MAKKALDIVIKARDDASRKFGKVGKSAMGMGKMFKAAGAMAVTYFGARAAKDFLTSSTEAFGRQKQAVTGLSVALDQLGAGGSKAMKGMKQFAASIQRQTVLGDEAVLELSTLGASLGRLSGQALKDATVAAIGLSKRMGVDTVSAMRLVSRAAVGDTATLSRYGIKLDATLSPQEKFNQLLKMGAESFALAKAETRDYAGKMKQLGNIWGDMKEKIGEQLAPMILDLAETFRGFIPTIQTWITSLVGGFRKMFSEGSPVMEHLTQGFRDIWAVGTTVFDGLGNILSTFGVTVDGTLGFVGTILSWITKAFKFMAMGVITSWTLLEVAVVSWRDVMDITWKSVKLGAISFARDTQHLFTVVIPDLLGWFSRNWRDVFETIWRGTKAIFMNMFKNIAQFFKAVYKFFKGGGFDFKWTGLLDGFESTLKELPKIAARELGRDEILLRKQIGELGTKLGDEFQKKLRPRLKMLEGDESADGKPVAGNKKGLFNIKPVKLDASAKSILEQATGKGIKTAGGPRQIAAVEARFLTRAPGHYNPYDKVEKINIKIAKNTENMAKEMKDFAKAMKEEKVNAVDKNIQFEMLKIPAT